MAEYIDKENALLQLTGRFPHSMSLEKYIGLVNFRLNGLTPADVIERSKIDKAIEEMENEVKFWDYTTVGKELLEVKRIKQAKVTSYRHAIEILKRNIGE